MKNIIKIAGGVVIAVLVIDFLGFTAWIASGQYPVDDFYIGTITAHVLRLIIH
jgi:hypothetical protein